MPDNFFLGIDFGTQSVRVGVVDEAGIIHAESECPYSTEYSESGWVTQSPASWWNSFITASKSALSGITSEEKNKIHAAAVCATSSSVVMLDSMGNTLGDSMLWMDIRAREQAQRINNTHASVLNKCGGEVSPEWLLPKVLWIKENTPEDYNRAQIIFEQLDYINYRLSGVLCASACNAVCKGNYDIDSGFDDSFMKEIGLEDYREKLALNVLQLGSKIGQLNQAALDSIGLQGAEINLYQGGIDAHVAMYGMGVVDINRMAMIMGTSFVQFVLADKAPEMNGIWGPYRGAMSGDEYLLECGQISAGSLVKWFKQISNIQGANPYDVMMDEADAAGIGANGLRVLDYFQGNRTPYKNPDAKGVIYGLTLQHTRGHIYRALLESVACGARLIVDNFENNGIPIDRITVCGGVTRDPLWLQIIADVTGKNLIINDNTHAGGVMGCALIGAVGEGIYSGFTEAAASMTHVKRTILSDTNRHTLYEPVYRDYIQLYELLKPMLNRGGRCNTG
ncbi:MAG: FGGY-family carbohydrate kinase [Eubacteriales bacterium]